MIHWLVQSFDDCPAILGSSPPQEWLAEPERRRLATFKVDKRRQEWLLGRWTAKRLVQSYLATITGQRAELADVVIAAAADGSPYCALPAAPSAAAADWPVSLAISHSHGHAFCALCPAGSREDPHRLRYSLGCDLEFVEAREPSFVRNFFAAEEIAAVEAGADANRERTVSLRVTAVWSAKEAVLKAIRTGLRTDTRRLVCGFTWQTEPPNDWTPFAVTLDHELSQAYPGQWSAWWRVYEDFVLTMALHET